MGEKNIVRMIQNFRKRWKIDLNEAESWESFRNLALNHFVEIIEPFVENNTSVSVEILNYYSIHSRIIKTNNALIKGLFPDLSQLMLFNSTETKQNTIYDELIKERDISRFLYCIQVFFWVNSLQESIKIKFLSSIKMDIDISKAPIRIIKINDNYEFVHKGNRQLDSKLVDDVVEYLDEFPASKKVYLEALKDSNLPDKKRDVLNNLRLSLELFVRQLLGNTKTLEKNKIPLSQFLEKVGFNKQINYFYITLFDHYTTNYQNNNIKHNDIEITDAELDFILYLTGSFIRFIVLAQKENNLDKADK